MAGLGRKTFVATEVLTAANVNGYLMDQSVMKYANAAAATASVGTAISEGMQFYFSDTDENVFYNGSSFQKDNGTTNAIINGAFDIWQRGTSFTSPASFSYTADRWRVERDGTATFTVSQQAFTPGAAPVTGYEGKSFYRLALTTATSGTYLNAVHPIEDVRTFAGQTVTLSFWAKADSARSLVVGGGQYFGTGGSPSAYVNTSYGTASVTTSWQRFTFTIAMPSISGKTIGTNGDHSVILSFIPPYVSGMTIDIWGVQLEAGSVATPFKRNAPSIQAELAACQRYYQRIQAPSAGYTAFGQGYAYSATSVRFLYIMKSSMRTPTAIEFSNVSCQGGSNSSALTSVAIDGATTGESIWLNATGGSGLTQGSPYFVYAAGATTGYVGISAEL